jgi:hypothetical protein
LSIFSFFEVVWSNTVASLLFEGGNLTKANKSMKENKDLCQSIQIKWPYSVKLQICEYSHINFHKCLTFKTRSFLQDNCHNLYFFSGWESWVSCCHQKCTFYHFVLLLQIYLKFIFQNKTQKHYEVNSQ